MDLAPGDTFAALEDQLKRRIADRFDNAMLGVSASIGSKRNASELAKHLASGEEEEAHKFAAKNVGMLFVRGQLAISHKDKKAVVGQRWITRFVRVFTPFRFAGNTYLATLTLKGVDPGGRIYAVEAVEINQDAKSGSTPRGAMSEDLNSAPFQDLTSQLADMVSYYVGDVNRTCPKFLRRAEPFTVEHMADLLKNLIGVFNERHLASGIRRQAPVLTVIIPSFDMDKYLPKCLDSLVVSADLMERLEVLVVNDGSRDRTSEIAHEFAARYPGTFRVIDKPNGHYGSCINVGLAAATGAFVKVLDADDSFDTSALESHLRNLQQLDKEDVDVVFTDFVLVHEDGREGGTVRCGLLTESTFDLSTVAKMPRLQTMHTLTYRTSVLKGMDYRQTEGMPYTDNEWALKPMRKVGKMVYRPLALYRYLVGRVGQSVSSAQSVKNVRNLETILEHMLDEYRTAESDSPFRSYAAKFVTHNARLVEEIAFFSLPLRAGQEKIRYLEGRISKECPEAFKALADMELDGRFKVKFIAGWRRRGGSVTVYVLALRLVKWAIERQRKLRGL